MFVDIARARVRAGKGGNGCLSFRRERFIPRGGPDGGDGGRGGHIIFRATHSLTTLEPFRYQPLLRAKSGQHGMGKRKHGADGEDLIVPVPVGTIVQDAETRELIVDMAVEGQEEIVVHGGRGGLGNDRFKSATNRAPRKTTPGLPGEERTLDLELRLIADVGLIGMPNAGKSTLISRISSSHPKIADYPFTTLEPNLGVVDLGDYRSCVVADIPGLIPGAHMGKGLGDRFLRHVARCELLLHLVDASVLPERAAEDFDAIQREMALFSPSLATKTTAVVLTKIDLPDARMNVPAILRLLETGGIEVVSISAVSGEGLPQLLGLISCRLASTFRAGHGNEGRPA